MTKKAISKTNYVLIDFENRPVESLALLKDEHFRIYVFLGKDNPKIEPDLAVEILSFDGRAKLVELDLGGGNALDFYIAYYVGELAAADPAGFFHIISGDKGFDQLIEHIKGRKIFGARSESIEEMPCFRAPPTPAPTPVKVMPKPALAGNAAGELMESWIEIVLDELVKRGDSRPVRMKTLVSTIHNSIGKDRSQKEAEAVRDALVKRKVIVMDGVKFSYKLPKA